MKRKLFIVLFIGIAFLSCKPTYVMPAYEEVTGIVTDEDGKPLQGIRVEKYMNEEPYRDRGLLGEAYSNVDGVYHIYDDSHYSKNVETKEFYIVAIDSAGTYQSQTIIARMTYQFSPGDTDAVGYAEVNVIMTKVEDD